MQSSAHATQVKFNTAKRELSQKPLETYNLCKNAINELERQNRSLDQTQWKELLQKAEIGIAKIRTTRPGYASEIILTETPPIQEREIQSIIPQITSDEIIVTNNTEDRLESLLQLYKNYINNKNPRIAYNLCNTQIRELTHENVSGIDQLDNNLNKTLEIELWQILKNYSVWKYSRFIKEQSLCFHQAFEIQLNHQTEIVEIDAFILNNFSKIPQPILSKLIEIKKSEFILAKKAIRKLEQDIENTPQTILKFINNSCFQKGINWDRFSKIQTSISFITTIIDPIRFPQLYQIAIEGHENLENNIKNQFSIALFFNFYISLLTATILYFEKFPIEITILIPLFIFAFGLLTSIIYHSITLVLADEAVLLDIKKHIECPNYSQKIKTE